eukprot:TRINITY_DN526_c0_g1_i1.p1 TRINITY_DN526_c0_g1~~TRINITY_DN526_c0_g1_i1.p1  ORF type:complete len:262 (+),score=81.47 TRINITY_DN526_c0_g1_i1:314-1099(+)
MMQDALDDRSIELPPRTIEMAILVSDSVDADRVSSFRPVRFVFVDSEAFWAEASHFGVEVIEPTSTSMLVEERVYFWKPSPLVASFVKTHGDHLHSAKCLDLGCGTGRNAVWCAWKHGWNVLGVDQRRSCIERMIKFAKEYEVEENVEGKICNLKKERPFEEDQFDVILSIRTLVRQMFADIWKFVKIGGFLVVEHFMVGCEKISRPTKRLDMLDIGETQTLIEPLHREEEVDATWMIVDETVGHAEDGRPLVQVIAKRIQ